MSNFRKKNTRERMHSGLNTCFNFMLTLSEANSLSNFLFLYNWFLRGQRKVLRGRIHVK